MKIHKRVLVFLFNAKERLWDYFDAFSTDEMYLPNTSDVLQKYLDFKVDDIEEFAAAYTYDYHDRYRILDNAQSKAKMHLEVYRMMMALEKRGSLKD